jgi:hypothetical protein
MPLKACEKGVNPRLGLWHCISKCLKSKNKIFCMKGNIFWMSYFRHITFVHRNIRVGTLEVVVLDVCFAWVYGCNKSLYSNWRLVGFDNKCCLSWGEYELLFLKRKNWWRFATLCMVSVLKMHVLYNSYEKRKLLWTWRSWGI